MNENIQLTIKFSGRLIAAADSSRCIFLHFKPIKTQQHVEYGLVAATLCYACSAAEILVLVMLYLTSLFWSVVRGIRKISDMRT